jgi:hypothetical protein
LQQRSLHKLIVVTDVTDVSHSILPSEEAEKLDGSDLQNIPSPQPALV